MPDLEVDNLTAELRRMVDSSSLDETTYRRLMLVAMADLQRRMVHLETAVKRDWTPVIVAVAVAVMTVATIWLRP